MKTMPWSAILLIPLSLSCDESKTDGSRAPGASASSAPVLVPSASPAPAAQPAPAAPTWNKRSAGDCKPHSVDFGGDAALEREVRRKLGKETGAVTAADLAQIKSINLANGKVHQIDPCIFPMFTSLKDLFLGAGEYDDLTPIQKLTTLEALRISLSQVKDLRPIEGLKRLDRLDLSHTLIGDEQLKSVASLVNVTELMLDEDQISDLSPVANMKKLERLSIKKTLVKSLAPLAQLKSLKFLYIADTPVNDITPVQPMMSNGMKLIQN
ncbi:MAG: leucine-rich repeat domain-containing protein [Myxococcota bacterium]|nr:leucine-rich repeat domain-containing protein [Myxococcota bacterium]